MSKLPINIETDEDWDKWDYALLNENKERLVDFIMQRMSTDSHTMKLASAFFDSNEDKESKLIEDIIKSYILEMEIEISSETPDPDYIISLTERYIDIALSVTNDYEKREILIKIKTKLSQSIETLRTIFDVENIILIEDEIDYIEKIINKTKKLSEGEAND